jgi:hypothetical protein
LLVCALAQPPARRRLGNTRAWIPSLSMTASSRSRLNGAVDIGFHSTSRSVGTTSPRLILFSGNVQSRLPDNRSVTINKCGTDSLSQRIWRSVTSAPLVKTMGIVCPGGRCPLLTGEARVRCGRWRSCRLTRLLGKCRRGRIPPRRGNLRPAWTALLSGALCYRIRR